MILLSITTKVQIKNELCNNSLNYFFKTFCQTPVGSKLRKGDKIRLTQLAKGFELLASDVVRDGNNLGSYHAAKDGGLTSMEIIV